MESHNFRTKKAYIGKKNEREIKKNKNNPERSKNN